MLEYLKKEVKLRDTKYAKLLAEGIYHDSRIERIFVKDEGHDEIRFSWWPAGKMANRPLDLPEDMLLELLKSAISNSVFTDKFLRELHSALYDAAISKNIETNQKK